MTFEDMKGDRLSGPNTRNRRISIRFESPDFGVCKDCGNPLFMLRIRNRHKTDALIAACSGCDVIKVT